MLKRRYNYFLFDFDRTIWDFDGNSKSNILELLSFFNLKQLDGEQFYLHFDRINREYWALLERGEIEKERVIKERFGKVLELFNIDNPPLGERFGEEYLERMAYQTKLMPYAKEVLEELKSRGAKMAIVTNGFKEVQRKKLENSGVAHHFDALFISEEQGVRKPSPIIFKRAVEALGAVKSETIMVGDDFLNDIEGAMIFGIDQFFYNSQGVKYEGGATYHSTDLRELL